MMMGMGRYLWQGLFNSDSRARSQATRRSKARRQSSLRIEALEERCLLAVANTPAFLQGFSFVDSLTSPNGRFDSGEQIAGATISLYPADTTTANLYHAASLQPPVTTSTVLASFVTGADGYYLFNDASIQANPNLAPNQILQSGNYQLVETPPAGYVNNGTDARAIFNPATGVNLSTIQVTLENSGRLSDHFDSTGAGAPDSPTLDGTPKPGFTGQMNVHLTDSPPPQNFTSPEFTSLCLDLSETVSGGTQFPVLAVSSTTVNNGGQIAYLYNHYGTITLDNVHAEALQEAVWQLLYSGTSHTFVPDLSHAGVAAAYNAYLAEAAGKNEVAAELVFVSIQGRTNGQSMIATDSLNFNNVRFSPTLTTTPGGTIVLGSGVNMNDTATLSGGYTPTGTITFTLYDPNNVPVYVDNVSVNGNASYTTNVGDNAGGYSPTMVGAYHWVASYSGDAHNSAVVGGFDDEPELATPASPSLVTQASAGGVVGSVVLADTATLSGGYNVNGGIITFTLTAPDGSTQTESVIVNAGGGDYTTPMGILATQVGTYTWHAHYSGNATNNPADDDGANETATVVKAGPTIVTSASETGGGVVGTGVLSDTATISGGYLVGAGSITFSLTAPDGTTSTVGTVTVTGAGVYDSPTVLATQVGTYTWHASYTGDGLNNGAIDNGVNESLTTVTASPSINTHASPGGVVGVVILTDTATLSGGYNVNGGTITFTLTAPDGSTQTESVTVDAGDGDYTTPSGIVATQVGSYTWHAHYSGNATNGPADDDGANETATIVKASPMIVTSASETGGGVVGTAVLSDTATISGGYHVSGGSITFTLTAPDGATSTVGSVPVTAASIYSSPTVLATQVGTYTWHASYTGDGLNNGAIDNGVNESLTTVKAIPSISTQASQTGSGVVGTAMLSDSAIIVGGYNVTGIITFTLTAPDHTIQTQTVSVNGAGTYSSAAVLATQVGTYTWSASYSGNGLNSGAVDNGQNESVTTVKASPTISTHASATNGSTVGSAQISDTVIVAGGYNLTGSVTFTLTAPNGTTTTIGTITITGAGTYASPSVLATQVGTYTWHATYNGDSLNIGAVDNGQNESVTIVASHGLQHGDFATIGFWHNRNGQALIQSLNGGSSATALAQWLATTFPNLYGPWAGATSMAPGGHYLTNSQVAALYLTSAFFGASGMKVNAQILAVALGVYVTSSNLAGGTMAGGYGFNVSTGGTGSDSYNVGSDGAAYGVANNTTLTVLQLLRGVNGQAVNGVLYANAGSNRALYINMANTDFSNINQSGDIT
jgi:hypothetical protein